ncbi:MAG: SCP2 sterol-binding domain-containing protein [Oligoflexia bacterium]|nr:SCP2 sterol-binding domain-containing protein [Oligoflexia bacterium]
MTNDSNEQKNDSTGQAAEGARAAESRPTPPEVDAAETERGASKRYRNRNFRSARDFMLEELKLRCDECGPKLKECLNGSICIRIRDKEEIYFLDWGAQGAKVEEVSDARGDCVIELAEVNFLKILSGELNPQIAMLSEKIFVQGRLGLAIYFFNLVAPQPH